MRAGPSRRSRRSATIAASVTGAVRLGQVRGRLDRSVRPWTPSARDRASHLQAVARLIPISAATWAAGRPVNTRSTNKSRDHGDNRGLACSTGPPVSRR